MIYLILFPGVALVTMIIIFAIFGILRYGAQLCDLRHYTLEDREIEERTGEYAQSVSYDV